MNVKQLIEKMIANGDDVPANLLAADPTAEVSITTFELDMNRPIDEQIKEFEQQYREDHLKSCASCRDKVEEAMSEALDQAKTKGPAPTRTPTAYVIVQPDGSIIDASLTTDKKLLEEGVKFIRATLGVELTIKSLYAD